MFISRNTQFNGVLIILYALVLMITTCGLKIMQNPYIKYPIYYLGWMNVLFLRGIVYSKCKSGFGVSNDDPMLFYTDKHKREIHISKISKGKSFDCSIPDPLRLLKMWDKAGCFNLTFITNAVYFCFLAYVAEYTKTFGDWGYDWEGVYVGFISISASVFVGGCIGVLTWMRKPMVTIYQS